MKSFMVTVRTQYEVKHFPVNATCSAEALAKVMDRVPLFGASVKVTAL